MNIQISVQSGFTFNDAMHGAIAALNNPAPEMLDDGTIIVREAATGRVMAEVRFG